MAPIEVFEGVQALLSPTSWAYADSASKFCDVIPYCVVLGSRDLSGTDAVTTGY